MIKDRPARLNPSGEKILMLKILERITTEKINAIKDKRIYKNADTWIGKSENGRKKKNSVGGYTWGV